MPVLTSRTIRLVTTSIAHRPISFFGSNLLQANRKNIHVKKFTLRDAQEITMAHHETIRANKEDRAEDISEAISSSITSHKSSLFFLTQKSRLLHKNVLDRNSYLPLSENDIANYGLMLDLIHKQLLGPDGGHACMAITDSTGSIIDETQVSLRPDKKMILSGTAVLHPHLFSRNQSNAIREARHSTITEEIAILARKMKVDNTVTADITIIPLTQSLINISEFMENIKSARAIKLYNLCTSIVKENDITQINDRIIKGYIDELIERASTIPDLKDIINDKSDVALAALACTHAIIKACFGNIAQMDLELGHDQATQTVVAYCVMRLIGVQKYFEFAKQINFYDATSHLTSRRG